MSSQPIGHDVADTPMKFHYQEHQHERGAKNIFRVGSRNSQLALIQTKKVIELLSEKFPEHEFDIVSMTTTGDNIIDKALWKIGEKSLFTKELEIALIENKVDFVVHSLKDVPTELPEGLAVGAIIKRDDSRDALVVRKGCAATSLDTLSNGSTVGTSSLRRTAQLKKLYPNLKILDVRGNLNTRLRKLDEDGVFDSLILATAGLQRLGWHSRITQIIPPEELMYAVGQGAMAVECRADDIVTLDLLALVNDLETSLMCIAERAFLRKLEGGCSVPVAVNCSIQKNELRLAGAVYSLDGSEQVKGEVSLILEGYEAGDSFDHVQRPHHQQHRRYCKSKHDRDRYVAVLLPGVPSSLKSQAEQLGLRLADELKSRGADPILIEAKRQAAEDILKQKESRDNMKKQAK
ncbi:hypothetical protein HELRODRAFT_156805 [Helobdella robusta]|uniref:hydroxymethylbilane synthase n=1 Tax=Helobdella robusta TaxID=6412 RepID=T1EM14_HELRO|nr:hypothetical protein HELRODRAFT_156805 [Helobdella robusta]ESO06953.1 hypothetical protein HELRODRAFT_156805 [Helobdella robusta]